MHAYRTHTCGDLAHGACRRDRAPVGLGAPQARPWRRCCSSTCATITASPSAWPAPHSPAYRRAGPCARKGDPRRRRGEARAAGTVNREPADRRDRGLGHRGSRCWPARGAADAGLRRRRLSRGDAARTTASSTCGARRCTATSCCASDVIARLRRRMSDAGLHRVPDADPDRVLARRRARLSWCRRRAASRASSTRCRRRRSSSSSCSWSRASTATSRSRPASATRTPAPTARPGEFYQLDLEMSFVTQEDVFAAIEPVLRGVFEEFGEGKAGHPPAVPAHPLRRSDAEVRHRQARSAQPDRSSPMSTDAFPRLGLRRCSPT